MSFRVLAVGDIVGRPGRNAALAHVSRLRAQHNVDFCVVNGENAAGGKGINREIATRLLDAGADVLTLGNHVWDNKDIIPALANERILRPANYPPTGVPGHGVFRTVARSDIRVTVIHLMGRVFMGTLDCPFRAADSILADSKPGEVIIIDLHAEATSEKKALALYLDGRASLLFGTHTHVQTADEQILPHGLAFISDVGMTGPHAGVIGMRYDEVMDRFLKQMPTKYEVAAGEVKLQALLVDIDETTGRALTVKRISLDIEGGG